MKISKKTSYFISFFLMCLIFINPAQGTISNKDNIISDSEFRDYQSMTQSNVQTFLVNRNCFLATYKTTDMDGVEKLPSEMIYNAAQKYHINPKVILTMLQKEQSIISTPLSKQTTLQLNKAMGYESPDYYGLANQIDRGTWQLNHNIELIDAGKTTINGWTIGVVKETVDHVIVTPETKATASLYSYNPLAGSGWGGSVEWGGNYLFWDLYYNKFEFSIESTCSDFIHPTDKTSSPYGGPSFLASGCDGKTEYGSGFYHLGQDIKANVDDPVYAIADGDIVYVSYGGWENDNVGIFIEHTQSNGQKLWALYGHIKPIQSVKDKIPASSGYVKPSIDVTTKFIIGKMRLFIFFWLNQICVQTKHI